MITKYLEINDKKKDTTYIYEVSNQHDIKKFDLDINYLKMFIEIKLNKKLDDNISYRIHNTIKETLDTLGILMQDEGTKIYIHTLTKFQKQ